MGKAGLDRCALYRPDAHRSIQRDAPAGFLAGSGADRGESPGQRKAIEERLKRRAGISGSHEPDDPGNVGMRGTCPRARRLAVPGMLREQELQRGSPGISGAARIRADRDAF